MHTLRMLLQTVLGFLFTIGLSWILLAISSFVLHFIRFNPFEVNGIEILLGSLLGHPRYRPQMDMTVDKPRCQVEAAALDRCHRRARAGGGNRIARIA